MNPGSYRGTKAVILLMPTPLEEISPDPSPRTPDPGSAGGVWEALGGTPLPGGKPGSVGGEAGFPQRGISKERKEKGGGAAPPDIGESAAPLYRKPAYDRAAAAVLVDRFGMAPRVAHGLVSQYRPTGQQVLNVLANIEARDAEAASSGGRVAGVRNRVAFVTGAIKRCDYALDDRVLEQRREAARRARAREQAQTAREAAKQRQHEQADREADQDALWASLSAERREALRREAMARLPEAARRFHDRYPTDSPAVRCLVLAELQTQKASEP